jgi:hypothetical protein
MIAQFLLLLSPGSVDAFTIRRRVIPTVPVSLTEFPASTEPVTTNDLQSFVPWVDGEQRGNEYPTQSNSDLERYVWNEYNKWCARYSKTPIKAKYPNFKHNFLQQLQSDREHGGHQFFHLNEFGDLTPEEYTEETLYMEAYDKWCIHFNRKHSPQRFEIFKTALKNQGVEKEEWDLTEFADLTSVEFLQLCSNQSFLEHQFGKWLTKTGKITGNIDVWATNFLAQVKTMEDHTRNIINLDDSADLTKLDLEKEALLMEEYKLWLTLYDKSDDDCENFGVWKNNHQLFMEEDAIGDEALNNFADLSSTDFQALVSSEEFLHHEYQAWLDYYQKTSGFYDIWKGNYLLQLSSLKERHALKKFVFDEYSDLTQEGYAKALTDQFKYNKWCSHYGKIASNPRFQIFQQHLLQAKDWLELKEHADLTPSEFKEKVSDPDFIKDEFTDWLSYYDKKRGNLEAFSANVIQQVESLIHFKECLVFDEYSDLTPDAKLQEQELQACYKKWATSHNKSISNKRYQVYKENHARSVDLGKELNEDSDLTQEEFVDMVTSQDFVKKEFDDWMAYYNKTSGNFEAFHENYFLQLETLKDNHCFVPFVFDDNSDLLEEERVWEPIYQQEFSDWCETYNNKVTDLYSKSYAIWRSNTAKHIRANHLERESCVLTCHADQTKEVFVAEFAKKNTIDQAYKSWLEQHEKDSGDFSVFQTAYLLKLYQLDHAVESIELDASADSLDVPKEVDRLAELEYTSWCQTHGKEQDENRYYMFRHNFVLQLQNYTSSKLDLEEFADTYSIEGLGMNALYEQHYHQWANKFGVTPVKGKFEIFKTNFLQLAKHNVMKGTNYALNEFGSSTQTEYLEQMTSNENIQKEYDTWATLYGKDKSANEEHFSVFSQKIKDQVLQNLESGEVLYHQGDVALPSEDLESLYQEKYVNWATYNQKTQSKERYTIFRKNFVQQLEYNLDHGTCHSLNEHGDLTQEEHTKLKPPQLKKQQPYFVTNPADQALPSFCFAFV